MRSQLLALALAGLTTGCLGHSPARQHSAFDARAAADLQAIAKGNCAAVTSHFDAITSQLTPAQLCQGYQTYSEQFGGLVREDAAYSTRRGLITVVRIPLHLRSSAGEYRESFHPDGKVAGLYFLKPGVPLP